MIRPSEAELSDLQLHEVTQAEMLTDEVMF